MAIIWIIEKPQDNAAGLDDAQYSIAEALIGNHPVQVFASLLSFQNLLRTRKQNLADVIIVDWQDMASYEAKIADALARYLPDALKVFIGKAPRALKEISNLKSAHFLSKPKDAFQLNLMVDKLFRDHNSSGAQRSLMRFRDIRFDVRNFIVAVESCDDSEQLPLKEAQILRLLMEKTGQVLSREEIKEQIWAGLTVTPRTIDSHVSRLRGRLKNSEVSIVSVYGGGYQLR